MGGCRENDYTKAHTNDFVGTTPELVLTIARPSGDDVLTENVLQARHVCF